MPSTLGKNLYVRVDSARLSNLVKHENADFRSASAPGAPQSEEEPSPFRRALDEYLGRKSKNSKTPAFLKDLQAPGSLQTKDDVHRAMVELEKTSTDRSSARVVRKALKPVIRVLTDYSNIVDTLGMAFWSQERELERLIDILKHSSSGSDAHRHSLGLSEGCRRCKSPRLNS